MSLTLADAPLIAPSPHLVRWCETHIPIEDACPWPVRTWPGPDLAAVAFPAATTIPRHLKLSTLWWPNGASRFAFGHFLADSGAVERIRTAANGEDGASSTPVTLRMASRDDDDAEVMETDLTLLRITPLSNVPPDPDDAEDEPRLVYLLTLVDDRFRWQNTPAPDFGITVASTAVTWEDCFDAIGTALVVALDVDAIDPGYLFPDVSLNAPGASCAVLLDALAANVGKRVVRKLDGSVKVMGFTASQAVRQADDQGHPDRRLQAGGDAFRDSV